ncbi:MAG TPA: signal peptidase II [Caulobacter sp.]|nr:signal peptidase II [Caulobacter sp.]
MSLETPDADLAPQPPAPPPAPAAAAGPSQGPTAYALALAVLLADQLSKMWFLAQGFQEGESREVVWPFALTMVWNQGVSFGLFRGEAEWVRWALTAFSLVVAAVIAVWARKVHRPLLGWAFGLIMGGAIGNMIDRIRFGAVADFLDFQALMFPWVFNVADSAISIGVVLLLVDTWLADRDKKPPKRAGA